MSSTNTLRRILNVLSVFFKLLYFQEVNVTQYFLTKLAVPVKHREKYYFWTQFPPLRKAFPDKIYFSAKLSQHSSLDTISNTIKFNGKPKFRLLISLLHLLEIISLKIIMSSDDFLFPLKVETNQNTSNSICTSQIQ